MNTSCSLPAIIWMRYTAAERVLIGGHKVGRIARANYDIVVDEQIVVEKFIILPKCITNFYESKEMST